MYDASNQSDALARVSSERMRDPDPNWAKQFQELALDPH
jgi:hypothetical protein